MLKILNSNIVNVKPNIVTMECLLESFVVHLHRLEFMYRFFKKFKIKFTYLKTTQKKQVNIANDSNIFFKKLATNIVKEFFFLPQGYIIAST